PDASGRRRPVEIAGSEFDLPCDLALPAIGQQPIVAEMFAASRHQPGVSRWSTFEVDTRTMQTNIDGLFAGGDAADDGPTVIIDAIRDGRRAADAMHSYLSGEALPQAPFVVTKAHWAKPGQKELGEILQSPRHPMHLIPVQAREANFEEVATGYHYDDVQHECSRCLSCGCVAFHTCDLRRYSQEYGAEISRYHGYVRKFKIDDRHPRLFYDPNKCILCGRCIRTCERVLPISCLGLVNRGFKTEMRPAMNDPLLETSCIACGNCIDACPVGALEPKLPYGGRASLVVKQGQSHCGFCSVGCPITVNRVSDGNFFISSGQQPGDALCHDGRFGPELFTRS
ncbi:MAG: hypothetical protein GY842_06355, partial [bacterium]|nr:hypothetical protein [bacterium]